MKKTFDFPADLSSALKSCFRTPKIDKRGSVVMNAIQQDGEVANNDKGEAGDDDGNDDSSSKHMSLHIM